MAVLPFLSWSVSRTTHNMADNSAPINLPHPSPPPANLNDLPLVVPEVPACNISYKKGSHLVRFILHKFVFFYGLSHFFEGCLQFLRLNVLHSLLNVFLNNLKWFRQIITFFANHRKFSLKFFKLFAGLWIIGLRTIEFSVGMKNNINYFRSINLPSKWSIQAFILK